MSRKVYSFRDKLTSKTLFIQKLLNSRSKTLLILKLLNSKSKIRPKTELSGIIYSKCSFIDFVGYNPALSFISSGRFRTNKKAPAFSLPLSKN